jgi:hypothetical protein
MPSGEVSSDQIEDIAMLNEMGNNVVRTEELTPTRRRPQADDDDEDTGTGSRRREVAGDRKKSRPSAPRSRAACIRVMGRSSFSREGEIAIASALSRPRSRSPVCGARSPSGHHLA